MSVGLLSSTRVWWRRVCAPNSHEQDSGNANAADGTLPDGNYYDNTDMELCCRDDGGSTPFGEATGVPVMQPMLMYGMGTCNGDVRDGFTQRDTEDKCACYSAVVATCHFA